MNYVIINIIIFVLYCLASGCLIYFKSHGYKNQMLYQIGLAAVLLETEAMKARDLQKLRDSR